MKKVTHLIPYDGIGGVEAAARSMVGIKSADIDFQLEYIFRPAGSPGQRLSTFSPVPILATVRRILAAEPDLLIVSLWRSCIVAWLVKRIRPETRLVLILHLPVDVHCVDRFFTRRLARLASEIWADSDATLTRRLPEHAEAGRVISFMARHLSVSSSGQVRPVFLFWGRIHAQKGLERAVRVFSDVHAVRPDARFIVIGPDGGALVQVQGQVRGLGLSDAVNFVGPMDMAGITRVAKTASFYLQTSDQEGMAMSVVEAMQLGLVPVVSPVGEIGNYCRDGENAVIVNSDDAAVSAVLGLIDNDDRFQRLRSNAVATWRAQPLYAESILGACRNFLGAERAECAD